MRSLLESGGAWSAVSHLAYHPGAEAYVLPKHEALGSLEREA